MKRQGGFTLIELVVVIVILGILAVTAAPRFLNLQTDARAASLSGLNGAIAGATGIVYGGSAVAGEERLGKTQADAQGNTPPQANGITTHFGYPTANAAGIEAAVDGLIGNDWAQITINTVTDQPGNRAIQAYTFAPAPTTNTFVYDFTDGDNNTGCFVIYVEAADANNAAFSEAVTNAC